MNMRTAAVPLAAVALSALALASAAGAHKADPDYLTEVARVTPSAGLRVTVINRGDELQLHNTSGRDVVVEGYDGEPYARLAADGTVAVNTNSPAHYLNEDRFGATKPPPGVTEDSPPRWEALNRTGRFQWHDHRAHWMGRSRPPQVTDPDVRTKILDWSVPLEVDGRPGAIAGTLSWTPRAGGSLPLGAVIGGAALVVALSLLVLVARRRPTGGEPQDASGEAW